MMYYQIDNLAAELTLLSKLIRKILEQKYSIVEGRDYY